MQPRGYKKKNPALSSPPTPQHANNVESWVDFSSAGNHSLHYEFNHERVYVVEFDTRQHPPLIGPPYLLEKHQLQLNRAFLSESRRLGELTDDGLIMRLQDNPGAVHGKLIFIPDTTIDNCLRCLCSQKQMTKAEKRTLLQIVCGYSLREAAAADGNSYETKRVQLKSILVKTRMKRQLDLSNYVMAQLLMITNRVNIIEAQFPQHIAFAKYVTNLLTDEIRSHTIIGNKGQYHRTLDMGPVDGRPVIILHGHVLPCFSSEEIEKLQKMKLRLIWPLRNGLLGPKDEILGFEEHVAHAVQSIEIACQLFCKETAAGPPMIIGLGCAAHYCIAHAETHKDTAGQYVFAGANSSQNRKFITFDMFDSQVLKIANKNTLRASYLMNITGHALVDRSHLRKLLVGAYSTSQPDLDVIEKEFSDNRCGEALMFQFVHSESSINHDCNFRIMPDWSMAKGISQPVRFIHGSSDGINSAEDIQTIGTQIGALVTTLSTAGQLLLHSHFSDCLALVCKFNLELEKP